MGIFDKAKDMADANRDQADAIIDRASDMANERTGGKYADQVAQGKEFAKGQYAQGEQPPADAPASDQPVGEEHPPA